MPTLSTQRLKALIIDDETDICYLLSSILKQQNIQTSFAGSLAEADKMLQSDTSYNCIFLDNHLPDGLGINYVKGLKIKSPGARLIMMTAHDSNADRMNAVEKGVDFFIGKPFSKEIILKSLESSAGNIHS